MQDQVTPKLSIYYRNGLILGLIFLGAALLSIQFIDKPLALYFHAQNFSRFSWVSFVTEHASYTLIVPLYILLLFIFPINPKFGNKLVLLIYLMVITYLADLIKTKFRIICGRTWPETWSGSGPFGSLIKDNKFGFNFLKSNSFQGAFPSGHSTFITVTCVSMFLILRRFWFLWVLLIVTMVMCLLLLNYHYLGDCFAGIALGIFVANYGFATYLWLFRKFGLVEN